MNNKRFICITLIVVLLISLSGCSKKGTGDITDESTLANNPADTKDDEPVYGGKLVLPITTVKTLNPLLSENISYYHFSKLIFESLFELDNDLNVKNLLAEDYSIEDSGKTVKIKLRENVLWHDGEAFTANDVKFTIDTIKYAGNDNAYKNMILDSANNLADLRHILNVKVTDDYNLEIFFDRSFSNALEVLTFPIIPKHLFTNGKGDNSAYAKALSLDNYSPIGTGPYKFENYEKLKNIKLVANDKWWNGKPYIETIVGNILEDEDLVLTAFETGQVDLATTKGVDWEKFAQNERVKIYEFVSQNYEFLAMNFSDELFSGEKGLAIRKSIAYGVDRQSIIQKVYLGHGTQIDVPIHPNSWLISENANVYGYNKAKAKEILEGAGWIDRDNDGIREDENGKKLTLKLTTNSYNSLRLKTANMIVDDLKSIGIDVTKDYNEDIPDKLTDEMIENQWQEFNNKISKGNFDIALLGWKLSSIPDLSFAFHSSQISYGTNFIRYSNEKMDELLIECFRSEGREGKKEAYKNLEEAIVEDLPYVSLFFRNGSLLVDKKVHGDIDPQVTNLYHNIEKWYIPKELQSN